MNREKRCQEFLSWDYKTFKEKVTKDNIGNFEKRLKNYFNFSELNEVVLNGLIKILELIFSLILLLFFILTFPVFYCYRFIYQFIYVGSRLNYYFWKKKLNKIKLKNEWRF